MKYTYASRRERVYCEFCGRSYEVLVSGMVSGWGASATMRAKAAQVREASLETSEACTHCGALQKKAARFFTRFANVILLLPVVAGVWYTLVNPLPWTYRLLPIALLVVVAVAYRLLVPEGYQSNAPGIKRARLRDSLNHTDGMIGLWYTLAYFGCWVAVVAAMLLPWFSTAPYVLGGLTLCGVVLPLLRRHMYPR